MIVLANDYGKDRIVIDPKNVYLYTKVNQTILWRQSKPCHSALYWCILASHQKENPAIAGLYCKVSLMACSSALGLADVLSVLSYVAPLTTYHPASNKDRIGPLLHTGPPWIQSRLE